MRRDLQILVTIVVLAVTAACATSYQAKPLPFKTPEAYANATEVGGAVVAARAFADAKKAKEAFGFDIRGAGLLPVELIFDNSGPHSLEVKGEQTFLEDDDGNLWPILDSKTAYERVSKYSKTKEIFKKGAYAGFLGATAGAIIGAAVGIVTGENVAASMGKGAAVGAAAGATLGGAEGYTSTDASRTISGDLRQKSLQNKAIAPQQLAYGFLFFPGEAVSAKQVRVQLVEVDTGAVHVVKLTL